MTVIYQLGLFYMRAVYIPAGAAAAAAGSKQKVKPAESVKNTFF